MNLTTALRLAPTLIIMAVMGYVAYSFESSSGSLASEPVKKEPVAPRKEADPSKLQAAAGGSPALPPGSRNPFAVLAKMTPEATLANGQPDRAKIDPFPAIVKAMTLNGTFLFGKTRFASIDGRLYQQGQQITIDGKAPSQLMVDKITHAGVVLESEGKRYTLGYPGSLNAPPTARKPTGNTGRNAITARRGQPAFPARSFVSRAPR